MSDSIPVNSKILLALAYYACAKTDCESLTETLNLEEYPERDLSFDRGEPKDGSISIKADGKDVFELKEAGTMSNLERKTQYDFCARDTPCNSSSSPDGTAGKQDCFVPPPPCNNPVKVVIAALFGKEELKNTALTAAEEKEARDLRAAMGLAAFAGTENSSGKSGQESSQGSFISDRWRGWRMGGSAVFNDYKGPGGGSSFWLGYRQDRWDFRLAVQGDGMKLQKEGYDFRLGVSFEPIFHLRQGPLVLDPFLYLPEIGLYHLFAHDASGISFSPLGGGMQFNLNDHWSLYVGAKLRGAFNFGEEPKVGVEVPLGFSGHL